MKIGFVVNDVMTEEAGFTTTRLACEAVNQGHEVYVFGVGDIAYDPDECIRARARTVPQKKYKSHETYLEGPAGPESGARRAITVDELDVLMLRNVPSDDYLKRPWAADRGRRIRPRRDAARRDRGQRPERSGQGIDQDVLPAVSRGGPPADADHPRPRRNQGLRQRGRPLRAQAAAGLGRGQRVPGAAERHSESQPDDRRRQPRRVCHRPGVPAGRRAGRHAAVRHERPAAAGERQVRRLSPRPQRRRHAQQHPRRRQTGRGRSRPTRL